MTFTSVMNSEGRPSGMVPIGGLVPLPEGQDDLVITSENAFLLKTGVVALAQDFPLAPLTGDTEMVDGAPLPTVGESQAEFADWPLTRFPLYMRVK